jgi:RNA polymerase sigma factor (sigma-70 family)
MSDDDALRELFHHAAADPESAASKLFAQYADRLTGYARRRMSPRLQQKLDPEDIVQSALKSFFRSPHAAMADEPPPGNNDPNAADDGSPQTDELWGLLVVITLRKCLKYIKLFGRGRRDLNREVTGPATDEATNGLLQLIDRQPTPAEEAVLNDTLAKLSEGLTESECEMLRLRMEGATVDEIAAQCQCGKRTVERLLARLRDSLRNQSDGP